MRKLYTNLIESSTNFIRDYINIIILWKLNFLIFYKSRGHFLIFHLLINQFFTVKNRPRDEFTQCFLLEILIYESVIAIFKNQ